MLKISLRVNVLDLLIAGSTISIRKVFVMGDNKRHSRKKPVIITVITIAVICLAALVALRISPSQSLLSNFSEQDLVQSIENNDYSKAVKVYNAVIFGDEEKEAQYDPAVEQAIDDVVASWSSDDIDDETAVKELSQLQNIESESLSANAKKELRFINIEVNGNSSCAESEKQFENGDFYQALVALSEIDPSYSQYYYVEDFKKECETILLALISSPTTRDEYADYEKKIDLYLSVDDADCFKARKSELEAQHDDFYNAAPALEKAASEFEKEKYEAAFQTLETAEKKNPNNIFLIDTLNEYHNVYVVETAQIVNDAVQQEQYKEALNVVDKAIEIYDCDEFNDLRIYIKECKNPLYKAKNNVAEKIIEIKGKFSSGEVDVEKAKKEAGEYVTKSGKKFVLGDYYDEDVTLLSVSGEVATSLIGVDIASDVRDLSYDITHWGEEDYFALCLAADTVALIPVVGTVKYLKYSKEAGKGAKKGAKAAKDLLGGTTVAAKQVNSIIDNSIALTKNADQSVIVAKVSLTHLEKAKLFKKALKIRKNLEYTSLDDVAIYARKYKSLPPNYMKLDEAKALKRDSGIQSFGNNPSQVIPGKQVGGDTFHNWNKKLPTDKRYIECDVDCPNAVERGEKRIVFADDYSAAYYTDDHYTTFKQIY